MFKATTQRTTVYRSLDICLSAGPYAKCKSFAHRSRQTTTLAPYHSVFTGQLLFLTPSLQSKALKGTIFVDDYLYFLCRFIYGFCGWQFCFESNNRLCTSCWQRTYETCSSSW